MPMQVAALWRFPVKSMAGETLQSALVTADGIAGDRVVQVVSPERGFVTSRTHPALLMLHARLGDDGEPLVDGLSWKDPVIAESVRRAAGPTASLVRYPGHERFDVLPLLVATDGALQAFGHDPRRLRPNIVVSGVEGLAERQWPGRVLQIGQCLIAIDSLRGRCVMTTFDPDTGEQNRGVLKEIVRDFGGRLALNCDVIRGGNITVGDAVALIDEEQARDLAVQTGPA